MAAAHFRVVSMPTLWKLVGAFLALLAQSRKAEVSLLSPVAWSKPAVAWMKLSTKNLRAQATLRFASHANWRIAGSSLPLTWRHQAHARKSACFHLKSYAPCRSSAANWLTYLAARILSR